MVPCSFTVSSVAPLSFAAAGGTGSASVTTTSACTWGGTSSVSWITFGPTLTGSGTRAFAVAANTTATARSATMTIAGRAYTVTAGCERGLQPVSVSLEPGHQFHGRHQNRHRHRASGLRVVCKQPGRLGDDRRRCEKWDRHRSAHDQRRDREARRHGDNRGTTRSRSLSMDPRRRRPLSVRRCLSPRSHGHSRSRAGPSTWVRRAERASISSRFRSCRIRERTCRF